MSNEKKEMIAILLFVGLFVFAGVLCGLVIGSTSMNAKDEKISSLEYENELLKLKIETPKKDLLECQETMGKVWEEATVLTDAYNLCKAQLNKRKK